MGWLLKALIPVLLVQAAVAVTAQQHSAMKADTGTKSEGIHPCITAPTSPECSQFTYPQASAAADLGKLCSAMHFMAACSVSKACNETGAGPTGDPRGPGAAQISKKNPDICDPFQHVTTVCKLDEGMSRMSGCNNINTMCVPGSKVPACSAKGLTVLPTSTKVNAQVRSICEEMTMDGCERCMPSWQAGKMWADCDLLDTYSYLCYQMPEMYQCAEWHAMCKEDPSLKFCYPTADPSGGDSGGSGGGSPPAAPGPVMKMYFFQEMPFYILFKNWTPRTNADLAWSWIAIFTMGVLYEFLQMMYGKKEAEFWARRAVRQSMAAAAAARRRDLEVGGPLGEGVMGDKHVAGYDTAAGQGYSPPRQMVSPSEKTCCGGGGGGGSTVSSAIPSPRDSAHSLEHTSRPRSSCKDRRVGFLGWLSAYMQPDLIAMDIIRGMARFVLAGLAYLLMLAAMSFNVAIFFAVIAGVAVGSMLFGRWRWNNGVAEGYSHCGCGSS